MVRVRRILMDLFHWAVSGRRRGAPYFTEIPYEWFEGRVAPERLHLWGRGATDEAHARGMRLLNENLSCDQRDQYERLGYFEVVGGETGRRYRIKNGFQGNVVQLDNRDRPVRLLCFMPKGDLGVGDVMLAQKLALELFERDTLKVANKFSPEIFHSVRCRELPQLVWLFCFYSLHAAFTAAC